MKIILASQSPRRKTLLALTGLSFDIIPTYTDESRQPGESPVNYACRLSREKALAAASLVDTPAFIIAADTIVVDGDQVLEKPGDPAEAVHILQQLRGRTHHVITAVTVNNTRTGEVLSDYCRSPVIMRRYSDGEIDAYVASGDPFDKAGGYAIQNEVFAPSLAFAHCFANVMGLPLCHLTRLMWQFGLNPPADVPAACQTGIDYRCPVHPYILAGRSNESENQVK